MHDTLVTPLNSIESSPFCVVTVHPCAPKALFVSQRKVNRLCHHLPCEYKHCRHARASSLLGRLCERPFSFQKAEMVRHAARLWVPAVLSDSSPLAQQLLLTCSHASAAVLTSSLPCSQASCLAISKLGLRIVEVGQQLRRARPTCLLTISATACSTACLRCRRLQFIHLIVPPVALALHGLQPKPPQVPL
jgi:hypothetical protein